MQKKSWRTLAAVRKVLTCAICSIALLALFSFSKVPNFSDPVKLPTLDDSSGILETKKLWKPPPSLNFVPCVEPSPNYTSPTESRGYLLVHTNGGLNQMRAGICDMVAVARLLNATLVIPELDQRSFWKDSSNFSNVFDEDHFINALANDIKIIKKLPKELATGPRAVKLFRSWSGMNYYQDEIARLWEEYEVIRASKSDSRLANNNLPLDIQRLRCRACYEALRFAPQIEAMGKLLVNRMRSFGSYIALHLRFEKDMLAFSGCTQDLTSAEADELRIIRENTRYWRDKEINPIEQRSRGFCPLTPKEVGIFLSALGYPSSTPIYIAAGKIYGGDSHMADLRSRYPILKSKETLASVEELEPFTTHASQMAALDYIVSVESGVFIPSYTGNMARAVEGHRRFLGHKKTISPDRKALVGLFDKLEQGTLEEGKNLSDRVIEIHRKRQGSPRKRKGPVAGLKGKEKLRSEEPFYENPLPDCHMMRKIKDVYTSDKISKANYKPIIFHIVVSRLGLDSFSSFLKDNKAMAVSFLSTVPSLIPLVPVPLNIAATSGSRYPTVSVTIRCNKIEVDTANEDRFHRRDILKCVGATIGMELIRSSGTFVEVAEAADLIQRRQRSEFLSSIKDTLFQAIKANRDIIPSLLTLALNDAITYDKASKSGGPNGSIRFSSEISRPENKGLTAALNFIEEAKKEIDSYSKGGPISYADLIQLAAQSATKQTFLAAAIRKCGGNEEKGNLLYTAYGSNGQWGLFERNFGRSDTQEPDPEGRVPQWDKASVQELKDKFSALGLGPRQLAVLSAFLGPDQIATETLLAADPEVFPWVQKYQRSRETVSETDYEVDLITTFTKLSSLGQQINYEAYTYPVKKVDFSKLKL
ncbi:unnamed protein product [Prunus armeniaca]|uniref:O-fucosyltransferase family protein n=1 Tax=Prunus armeniaca TaxID=36596 RepID=A0A6J5WHB1_PRUAR|nr:unnamed protein product [Prunus armeniaca]